MSTHKIFVICILLTLNTFHLTLPAFAQFEDLGVGARGTSMGNAFTALADDVYAIYYNPAGLSNIKWKEIGLDYEKLYWGLDDGSSLGESFVAYVHSFEKMGTFGIGWLNFALDRYYTENTFIFAYGKQIRYSADRLPRALKPILSHFGGGSLRTGVKLKILSKSYGKTRYTENAINLDTGQLRGGQDPVFARGYSRLGFSLDFGFLYDIGRHTLGLTLNNINQPDMGLNSNDKVPLETKLGYAYKGYDFNMTADIVLKQADFTFTAGAEKWFLGRTFALRGGLGIGSREYVNLSLGGSYRYNSLLQFDYSFRYPLRGISDFYGSHQISLTLRLGVVTEPAEEELKSEIQKLQQLLDESKKEIELTKLKLKEKEEQIRTLEELKEKIDVEKIDIEKIKKTKMRDYWTTGMHYYKAKKYEDAIIKFEEILKLDPSHKASIKMIAKCKEAQELEKKQLMKKHWHIATHYYKTGEYEKAIAELHKILELHPTHSQSLSLINKAQEKIMLQKQEQEKKLIEKHYTQGLKAYHAGDLKTAIAELEAALKLDPKNEEIRILLERLKKEIELKESR